MSEGSRTALFLSVCATLIAAALLPRSDHPAGSAPVGITRGTPPTPGRPRAPVPALASSARRFLTAFLRYEVGDQGGAVTRTLRATATRAFAVELLRNPPRPLPGAPRPDPHLGSLTFAPVSTKPPLTSVGAVAKRPTGPDQLSFVFELSHGTWLASAPGE
jgi:hypothetical protein